MTLVSAEHSSPEGPRPQILNTWPNHVAIIIDYVGAETITWTTKQYINIMACWALFRVGPCIYICFGVQVG